MGKPNAHPTKDLTSKKSIGSLLSSGLSSNPSASNTNVARRRFDLNPVEEKLEVHDKKGSTRKAKSNKVEKVTTNAFKSNRQAKFEPFLKGQSSSHHEPGLRLSLRCYSNEKNKACEQEPLPMSQQGPNIGSTSGHASKSGYESELIVMSCLNCYLHVMVCDDDPKCPKCHKGECLLDMYRS
ncbi:hypothetical protein QVD17_28927 [Tagetes erecta]|uniref:GIR1-like zinc ribbon domain-containing protein n=1 Tax=Tagetes erecta TaxID=13708 RepID=A0AAD8NSS5_TARER|nr:hypothetical protein QVD17_28927 [Tagetes erecta]